MDRRKFITMTAVAGTAMLACGADTTDKEKPDLKKDCPSRDNIRKRCTCKNTTCPRWGICCECVFFHKEKGEKPACLR